MASVGEEARMTKVLIAVDDSDSSVRAAAAARKLFGSNAQYTVIHVGPAPDMSWGEDLLSWGMAYTLAEPPPGYVGAMPLVLRDAGSSDRAARTAQKVADAAELTNASVIGGDGARSQAIIDAAHACDVDVIVVGSHDRSWLSKLFDPSTEAALVRESDVPVLVAR
jgi:nucleotide-binding universal stress UspA family protein